MSQNTRNFWKGMFRTLEVALLIILILVMIELMLIYKDAHDNPEQYVTDRPRPVIVQTNVTAPQPMRPDPRQMAEADRIRREEERRRRQRDGGGPQAPRPQAERPAGPPPSSGGGGGAPQVMEFTRIRNHVANYFFDSSANNNDEPETNGPPAEITGTNTPPEALSGERDGSPDEGAGDDRIGTLGNRVGRPPHGFRFAIP